MSELDGLGALFLALGTFMFVIGLLALVCYIVVSIWEMKCLQKAGYAKAWFAWIPFANWYALADIAFSSDIQTVEVGMFKKQAPVWVFKFFSLLLVGVSFILNLIPIINSVAWIFNIFVYLAFLPPILKAIARKFNTTVSDGRLILDSIITLIAIYDVYAWSKNNEFNPYADISDIVGSNQFDYSGFQNNNQPYGYQQYQQPQGYSQNQMPTGYPQNGNVQPTQQQFVPPVQEFDGSTFESNNIDYVNELKTQEGTDLSSEFM